MRFHQYLPFLKFYTFSPYFPQISNERKFVHDNSQNINLLSEVSPKNQV